MAEFDAWAPYYDLVHTGLAGEAEYYVLRGAQCPGEVLELGCGTGRICIPMAMTGARVTGLDISRPMLRLCREKLRAVRPVKGSLGVVHADMRNFDLERTFRLVVAPYRTLMHLHTPEDQVRCLQCIRRHLSADGEFIFNVWAAKPSALARFPGKKRVARETLVAQYAISGPGVTLCHFHSVTYDEHRQTINEQHRFEHLNSRGKTVHEALLSLCRAWYTPREMEHLVHRCGFTISEQWGDFAGRPFTESSTEMIWVLKRAD